MFCVLSVSLSYCIVGETTLTDISTASVTLTDIPTASATAECGRNADGDPVETEFCTSSSTCESCNAGFSETSYPARAAIDGALATSWQSPALSEGEEFRAVNFTIELAQVCIFS